MPEWVDAATLRALNVDTAYNIAVNFLFHKIGERILRTPARNGERTMRKRVLIVTYYWPPSGGIGVHRCLKFAKYLRLYGWEPVICTAEDPEYPVIDEDNARHVPEGIEVLKAPIWEPYNLYKWMMGKKREERITDVFVEERRAGFRAKLGIWIRGNFFIPDARRFWIRPAVRFLSEYLRDHPVDAILTNGPPHTAHMIGYHLKKRFNIPWHADYQDPWTASDVYRRLMLNPVSRRVHEAMQRRIFRTADKITICSQSWKRDLEALGARDVGVIHWGYDEDEVTVELVRRSSAFTMRHYGRIGPDRVVSGFWKAIAELTKERPDFCRDLEIELAGFIGGAVRDEINASGLSAHVRILKHRNRREALAGMREAQVLLLIINDEPNSQGRLPGKLFEYVASRRPILLLGPDPGEASAIVRDLHAGWSCGHADCSTTKSMVLSIYEKYKAGDLPDNTTFIDRYSNRNMTRLLAGYLDAMIKP
jgi:glycosyltransferase involved in cell wall biosynthesis